VDAIRLSHINPEAAVAKAELLPAGPQRASALLQVAWNIAGDHPQEAKKLIAEANSGNKASDDGIQLDSIAAEAFVAAAQHNDAELRSLLQRGFGLSTRLILAHQLYGGIGPGPLVQVGIQNAPDLTTAFLQGLPPSSMKAELLLGAASALTHASPASVHIRGAGKVDETSGSSAALAATGRLLQLRNIFA
jgi:hypothetical protein